MKSREIRRRDFMKTTVGSTAGGTLLGAGAFVEPKRNGKVIGTQVGSISFVDEGVEQVLDILQERARVNALWLAGFTFGRGVAGRQVPGQPLPDHGKLEYDLDFHGGHFSKVHSQYYKDTGVDPKILRAPDHGRLELPGGSPPAHVRCRKSQTGPKFSAAEIVLLPPALTIKILVIVRRRIESRSWHA